MRLDQAGRDTRARRVDWRRGYPVGMLCAGDRPLLVGVRGDQAGIHRKSLAANEPFLDTAADHGLENMSERIAVTKAAMTVLREGGVIRHPCHPGQVCRTSGRPD